MLYFFNISLKTSLKFKQSRGIFSKGKGKGVSITTRGERNFSLFIPVAMIFHPAPSTLVFGGMMDTVWTELP
jgi:hypothetical protein